MKATLLTSAIALFALSAAASPQQTAQQQPAPAETANVPQQTLTEAAPVQRADSPLVAAAKRAGRLGKKPSQVITNDTLAKSGGHVTTTKTQDPIASKAVAQPPSEKPAPAVAVVTAAQKRKAAEEQAKKDTAAAKERAVKRAVADYMGESIEEVNDDPSVQEGVVAQASTPAAAQPPKAAQPPAAANKPPTR